MKVKPDLKYTIEHEWVRIEGNIAYIGISDYAQEHMGDIVFVEMPIVGDEIAKGDVLCVLESVKAASDVYAPVTGNLVEINEDLADNPSLINEDPYKAWIAAIEMSDSAELEQLLSDIDYEPLCQE
ncbi:MAG: glycine cleavage system protein GcvH [Bacillota bacterium]|jgi:glycine cleavage system H protein